MNGMIRGTQRAIMIAIVGLAIAAAALVDGAGAEQSATGQRTESSAATARGTAKQKSVPSRRVAAVAAPTANNEKRVNRDILALYDGQEEKDPGETRIHRLIEMPLNHFGYRLTYWDIRKGLPPLEDAKRYYALATWFNEVVPDFEKFLGFADEVAQAGTRLIIMDFFGAPVEPETVPLINRMFRHVGLAIRPRWVEPSPDVKLTFADPQLINFERPPPDPLPGYMVYETVSPDAQKHAELSRPGHAEPFPSVTVVTSKGGGFASWGFTYYYEQKTQRMAWILNPFEFLHRALGIEGGPIADATTLAGRRIFFSHIDGDGWNNPSLIQEPGRPPQLVSEIVKDKLIIPYPDIPVSIGLIASDVDLAVGGTARAADVARALFALPHVEVASHSYSHPFDWRFYARHTRETELALIAAKNGTGSAAAVDPALLASTPVPPRSNIARPFDLDLEVRQSLDIAASLAPPGKRAELFLWSGDTKPFAAAIRATRQYGARNLNGGDTRYDSVYPSIAYISPLARQIDGERQIYTANANETIYTNGWTPPFDRFALLSETVAKTDKPRRLKPWNVYYHMYSGQRPESLAAVKKHLDAARASPVIPIRASEFAAIGDSFFEIEFVALGPRKWRVEKRGKLQTVRFDTGIAASIDWAESRGVLGSRVHSGSLYVALDPAEPSPIVALLPPTQRPPASPRPALVESRWQVAGLKPSACGFETRVQGFGPGEMIWRGLKPGAYTIALATADQGTKRFEARANGAGELTLALPALALRPAALTVTCR